MASGTDLDQAIHSSRCCSSYQTFYLSPTEVLCVGSQFIQTDIRREFVVLPNLTGVNVENLQASMLIRQTCRRVLPHDSLCTQQVIM